MRSSSPWPTLSSWTCTPSSSTGRTWSRSRNPLAEPLIRQALEDVGYEVKASGHVLGVSEMGISFSLVGRQGDELSALDLLRSETAVDVESMILLHGKIIDAKPSKAVVVAIPKFTDKARAFVNTQDIMGFEGKGVGEILGPLKEALR